uniref:CSD domain-containing protein n=1 Tax=Pyrodinium bahamense TaxID=73915 RepID=A0A7S0A2K1_9DINO|mmetsp:Transcript_20105/g.55375  ORF Transcript_20105/g.55375 Transcript_20105/m.55375 type:complete len:324 (+) Transcript_20105:121-1092(+)|eukprot:CAMPEP_0179120866 /NCGR_PEP_ID=MMETSP0796-20121207/56969_1 /TAXON_ID=73915 /ORGANISM="Pyrodinium bahamense, Strain pbaha01" /LENGTH=323 /DNA_ID=CAMNT_0020819427 /DNA_START=117 /DNA_END=1088 /DNA_ORIENTATION=+
MTTSFSEMLSTSVLGLLSIQWLEEGLIILSIGLAFITAHRCLSADRKKQEQAKLKVVEEVPSRRPPQAHKARAAKAPDSCEASSACRAPQTSAEMPGVTDARFIGKIISYKADDGYGFISCPELYPRFHRDVFLHRLQVGVFEVGASVSFGVFLNKNGHPQAKELALAQAATLKAACLELLGPNDASKAGVNLPEKSPLNPHAKPFDVAITEKQALNPHAEPFWSSQATAAEAGKAWNGVEPGRCAWPRGAFETEGPTEQQVSPWSDRDDSKQWGRSAKNGWDDGWGCRARHWVPKVKADTAAAGAQGGGLWVPKSGKGVCSQ